MHMNYPVAKTVHSLYLFQICAVQGLDFNDLQDFFAGPAFLAWGRMGNIQGYGGLIPWSYVQGQADLQHKIVARMRSFGMSPVYPGFAGFVPRSLLVRYPEVKATKSSNWCNFPEENCCVWMLEPGDPLFKKIGGEFVRTMRSEFGGDPGGFYAIDTFNELTPSSSSPSYLRDASAAVYGALAEGDPSAMWLMQGWMFFSDQEFWTPTRVQAVLSGVPDGRLYLLDLYADRYPVWSRTDSFYGRPFIWCMLHNFGGNLDMHGAMSNIAEGLPDALSSNSTIFGVGMAPEGIEQNPVAYELMSEMAFRDYRPDLNDWFSQYALMRYGGRSCPDASKSWQLLLTSVYQNTSRRADVVMDIPTSRPGLSRKEVKWWGLKPQMWYDPAKVVEAWRLLINCEKQLAASSAFQYDLVDVGRQVLSKLATTYWNAVTDAYANGDALGLQKRGSDLLLLLFDMDTLVSSHEGFLLGPWLESAREWGKSDQEVALLEWNARMQITMWGKSTSGITELCDYANREWGGLIGSFYRERWRIWLQRLAEDLLHNRPYDAKAWASEVLSFTEQWAMGTQRFSVHPKGDSMSISTALYTKYVGAR
eukprot:evm.model.scf_2738.1 EVM.evm.TU.scf_2738.1   scf_2738:3553-15483(-)